MYHIDFFPNTKKYMNSQVNSEIFINSLMYFMSKHNFYGSVIKNWGSFTKVISSAFKSCFGSKMLTTKIQIRFKISIKYDKYYLKI